MMRSFIYAVIYALIYLLSLSVINFLDGYEYIIFATYLILFLIAFYFKPNIQVIGISWVLIQTALFLDSTYHLYIAANQETLNIVDDFNVGLALITLIPVSPLIISYLFYSFRSPKNNKKSEP